MNNLALNNEFNLEALSNKMPGAFLWKKNLDSVYTELNYDCAELFGINKKRDILGFTDQDIPCKISEFAEVFREQDKQVIATGKPLQILEIHVDSKDQWRVMINTKNPLRDKSNSICGTFAYCIDITQQFSRMQDILSSIQYSKSGRLMQGSYILQEGNIVHNTANDFNLTNREHACLLHLLRGRTAKETAEALFISKRTVEKHIDHIRAKFKVTTKSQLYDKAVEHGFIKGILL